jgi:hypothetical protein
VFFQGISNLFLVIHELLLLIFDENALVDAQLEGGGEVLAVVVELWEGVFGWEGLSLEFGAELKFDVIFGRVSFYALQDKGMVLALHLASPFPFSFLKLHAIFI